MTVARGYGGEDHVEGRQVSVDNRQGEATLAVTHSYKVITGIMLALLQSLPANYIIIQINAD